jgi:LmbE family N-acetylglucosaminyl deacetylase
MTTHAIRSGPRTQVTQPPATSVLAVCAHPDDESFGLGAVLAAFTRAGTRCSLLCFTRGEASTLGAGNGRLRQVRAAELAAAAEVLGLEWTVLLDHPDGALGEVPLPELEEAVREQIEQSGAGMLLVFDEGGVTGHSDHCRATEAALAAAERDDLTVVAWTIPSSTAHALNEEFGTCFVGRPPGWIDLTIAADRPLQAAAIACHASQSTDNPVLRRRLELLGPNEHLRVLRRSTTQRAADTGLST